jgi:hypothetical protein
MVGGLELDSLGGGRVGFVAFGEANLFW